jgi:hypothetical protein
VIDKNKLLASLDTSWSWLAASTILSVAYHWNAQSNTHHGWKNKLKHRYLFYLGFSGQKTPIALMRSAFSG